ncbi:MAG: TauD/TfdA family dioxygenase [Magnetovibrio sp.]|nr:TauD/TfdA family dioxygenase [Magnetovibrio sp.]
MTANTATKTEPQLIGVKPASGTLGAEITGVDLSKPLDDATFAEVRQAFLDHLVIFFRGQDLPPASHVAFTERFGALEPHPLGSRRGLDDHPAVMVLENRPGKLGPRNDFWHSDISFAERPPALSMLHAIEVTEGRADTMFCNMYTAYEELSDTLRAILDGLGAVHDAEILVNEVPSRVQATEVPPGIVHPVVRTHPETGRKALFVNPYFTRRFDGMSTEESAPLLDYLYARATRHENIFRHNWRAGDVLMWDNRAAMHYAVRDYDDTMPRFLHRTTAAGDRPV